MDSAIDGAFVLVTVAVWFGPVGCVQGNGHINNQTRRDDGTLLSNLDRTVRLCWPLLHLRLPAHPSNYWRGHGLK